jgi:hypothetical protein
LRLLPLKRREVLANGFRPRAGPFDRCSELLLGNAELVTPPAALPFLLKVDVELILYVLLRRALHDALLFR